MDKSLFEQMDGTYTQQGDYVLPNLILPAENQPIGIWGQRHARHLKQYHKILYYNLLTSRKEYYPRCMRRSCERERTVGTKAVKPPLPRKKRSGGCEAGRADREPAPPKNILIIYT